MLCIIRKGLVTHEDPVGGSRQRSGARTDGERRILGGQQPGNGQQTHGEEEVEQEEHHNGDDACLRAAVRNSTRENRHAHGLTRGGEEHELAAAQLIDDPDGDEGREEVGDAVEPSQEQREVVLDADGALHDDRGVVGDQVDAGDLRGC